MEKKIKTQRIQGKLKREHFYCAPELSVKLTSNSKRKNMSKSLYVVQLIEKSI